MYVICTCFGCYDLALGHFEMIFLKFPSWWYVLFLFFMPSGNLSKIALIHFWNMFEYVTKQKESLLIF